MSSNSNIEWTDATWNPIGGCTKCSPGCTNCYAERMTHRLAHNPTTPRYAGLTDAQGRWTGEVRLFPDELEKPIHWRKPRRVFVCSMSDLFHESVPDEYIWQVLKTALQGNRRHTYTILTKRPERMAAWFAANAQQFWHYHAPGSPQRPYCMAPWPDPCLWLGVTVCNQAEADAKIPILLQIPAAVRWVSIEPMLGEIDLRHIHHDNMVEIDALTGDHGVYRPLAGRSDNKLDWTVIGAETGPGARPMHPDWARGIRDQCTAAGIPFFFKKDSNGNHELDGRTWEQFPEVK